MKVTLDLDHLLAAGEIDQADYERFSRFATAGTASLAFNLLVGFGVVAVAGAALAMVPEPATALMLGLLVGGGGIGLQRLGAAGWQLLAQICLVVGALLFGGSVIAMGEGSVAAFLGVAAVLAIGGVAAQSGLLVALAVLSLASCLGARTGYLHATYFLGIQEPLWTVLAFTALGIACWQAARRLPGATQRLAIIAARTSAFLVNFGFWIGSLWGSGRGTDLLPASAMAVGWAIALAAAGAWAWQRNRRWLVNVVAVFAAIHFYTQWFEHLGATPGAVLLAGLIALGFALGLKRANARLAAA